ncbi:MAG TPA: hypothetical protein VGQ85_06800, partial [Candidatus Limnocylindrales bacterium]|nr:hypothetical protein [Candidatus Limnocylindrales bacterium]
MTPAASRVDAEPGLDGLLSVDAARDAVLAAVPGPTDPEVVWLPDALGRVLAVDVVSELDLPPWDNSAMDGYVVRFKDLAGASETAPVLLQVGGDIPAGVASEGRVERGTALRIATGARIPPGGDAVIQVELTAPA